jgi:ubiquinone/menaquinone biosynthesis C-methylase UbiE
MIINLKKTKKIAQNIIRNCKKINKTNYNYHFIINELIFLNLLLEKILFDKKNKRGNPVLIINKLLEDFLKKILYLKEIKNFDGKQKILTKKFIQEKVHKDLFQTLWTNYSLSEYKKDRIDRYIKRIKINKLTKLIKNKKIIDFGCGHGNFLIATNLLGAKKCLGIDYGIKSLKFASSIKNKLNLKNISYKYSTVYKVKEVKSSSFDFAIQNGVFHHLDNENKAYKEIFRVLKPGGYMWVYTDGGGGIRDIVWDMSQKILSKIDKNFVVNKINEVGTTTGKKYHLGDNLNANYKHTNWKNITNRLAKIGFRNFKQMNGGFSTDFDKPYYNDKYFKYKFGSGDIRLICNKKV